MMIILQLGEDAVRLRFIPFALKDIAKKWLYNMPVSSISLWDDFVKVFLKKSTISIRLPSSERTLCSIDRKSMNRSGSILKGLRIFLAQRSHYEIEK